MLLTNIPSEEKTSSLFTAKVNGQAAKLGFARVSAMPFNCVWPGHQRDLSQTEEAAFLSLAMDAPAEIEVEANRDFSAAVLRPLSKGIVPEVCGRKIRFTISAPGQYSLELDGFHNPLFIFADPETEFDVDPADENTICFGPGVHNAGRIDLADGQTLYIHRDAVVYGWVMAINAKNIRILGNGILDNSKEERTSSSMLVAHDIARRNTAHDRFSPILQGAEVNKQSPGSNILENREDFEALLSRWNMVNSPIQLYGCENIELCGFTVRDAVGFTVTAANCQNLICDNLKLVGMWRYNSDGIDLFNSQNCTIKNCFLRNFDDCIVLKGIPGWDRQNMENILVENCVVWNDWGRGLEIGAETCADEYRNIIFRNCDVIHAVHVALDIQSCDRALVHGVIFENINVEISECDRASQYQNSDDEVFSDSHGEPMLICCNFGGETYFSNDRLKGQIFDITYKNIHVCTDIPNYKPDIGLWNYSDEHKVRDIKFDGIFVNGEKIEL